MKRIIQIYSLETVLLPLVICVIMPGMAGAWWRHSHGNLLAPVEVTEVVIDACDVPRTVAVNNHVQ